MSVTFCIAGLTELVNKCTCCNEQCAKWVSLFALQGWLGVWTSVPLYCQSVFLADEDLLKLVLECSELVVSRWKVKPSFRYWGGHHSRVVQWGWGGGFGTSPGVTRCSFGKPAATPTEVPAAPEPQPTEDEVVVKKRALRCVKQQVSALLQGEDLPEEAQAREVTEVPYQIPAVPREAKDCPVCQQSFKTHQWLMVHMGYTGVRNTLVQTVVRSWPTGKCGRDTHWLVSKVRRWHSRLW